MLAKYSPEAVKNITTEGTAKVREIIEKYEGMVFVNWRF
jgi:hypothetical protein